MTMDEEDTAIKAEEIPVSSKDVKEKSSNVPIYRDEKKEVETKPPKKPYWKEKLQSKKFMSRNDDNQTAASSSIVVLDNGQRQGKVTSIMGISPEDIKANSQEYRIYIEVSIFLAWHHLRYKKGEILSYLPQRLRDCDLDMQLEFRDSWPDPTYAAKQLFDAIDPKLVKIKRGSLHQKYHHVQSESDDVLPLRPPIAVLGSYYSKTTEMLNFMSYALQLPIMSPTSTSNELSGRPYFSRTVPTNFADARSIGIYLQYLNVTHTGILYRPDTWGRAFKFELQNELQQRNIQVVSVAFTKNNNAKSSVEQLSNTGYRYFVALGGTNTDLFDMFRLAHEHGIMGVPGYTWILTEAAHAMLSPTFHLNRATDVALAKAIHGSAVISLHLDRNQPFENALLEFKQNKTLQDDFISLHHDQEAWKIGLELPQLTPSPYNYFAFDTAIALGLAACETSGQFNGRDLQNTILNLNFTGVTGHASFDSTTGNRNLQDMKFKVQNLLISENRSTDSQLYFTSETIGQITLNDSSVAVLRPFIYTDNSTSAAPPLPPPEVYKNSIHPAAYVTGFILMGVVFAVTLGWLAWTIVHRNEPEVRSAQPIFLCQLCIGTLIMAATIIPLGFQEPLPQHILSAACMSVPWLLSIGFVTAFSALFSKAWRLNRLMSCAKAFKRVKVKPKDVMMPFLVLMSINIMLLLSWTFINPIKWHRVESSHYDRYGRSLYSYGICKIPTIIEGEGEWKISVSFTHFFLALVLAVNWLSLLLCLYQYYKGRQILTELSESTYLAYSTFILMETGSIAIPLLYASWERPSASFILWSVVLFIICLGIVLPIFVPKYRERLIRTTGRRNPKKQFNFQSNVHNPLHDHTIQEAGTTSSHHHTQDLVASSNHTNRSGFMKIERTSGISGFFG